ncbi:capsule biosynthesis GfcC family protein [Pantoea cypripedii]|uniref:capsule biosynthesis GfcC family protein n=1 Tax=Pantoea TaxID=53335 RepID=UPI0028A973C6|nr:capsule biosynthesis GfcC family protein [Pantoea sp.]
MKKITSLLAGLALFTAGNALADSQVIVHDGQNRATLQIDHAQNLSQLVTNPAIHTWWPGTVIAERGATAVAKQQQQQLLADLRAWQADNSGDRAAAIGAVIQQLSAMPVTGRQFTPLDPDWVRLRPGANRSLLGNYDLYTLAPPTQVLVLGALENPGKVLWQPGRTVRDYLDDHDRLSGGDRSFATVIAPSGQTRQVPIAYWNQRHVEVEPGSIIWLGFSSWSLPWGQSDLNDRMISVLTHRIPD